MVNVCRAGFRKALTTPTAAAAIAAAVSVLIVTPGTTKSTTIRLRAVANPDKRILHIGRLLISKITNQNYLKASGAKVSSSLLKKATGKKAVDPPQKY
jgi:hypothetical protein